MKKYGSQTFLSPARDSFYKAPKIPGTGHYYPNYSYLHSNKSIAPISHENIHISQKLKQKTLDHQRVCLKAIKELNYPVKHIKSEATQLAEKNRAQNNLLIQQHNKDHGTNLPFEQG